MFINKNWFGRGDIGAMFVIAFDNLTAITFISAILKYGFGFPDDILLRNVIPGCTASIVFCNILFLVLYKFKSTQYGPTTMAIPNGIDTPSALGFTTLILGPTFLLAKKNGMDLTSAGILAWHVTAACMVIVGVLKLIASLVAKYLHSHIPSAALFSAIGGIGLSVITFFPIISAFAIPTVGFPVLAILIIAFYAGRKLPFNISPIPFAIIVGVIIYYLTISLHFIDGNDFNRHELMLHFSLPHILNIIPFFHQSLTNMATIIPFSLLVIFGAITVVEGANKLGGEQYSPKAVIAVDAIATILGGLCGSVIQTTPYAGFIAYKKMDARAGFLIFNLFIILIGGLSGLFVVFMNVVPTAAIAPVLVFVGFEITHQGFHSVDHKYVLPILFGFIPSIAKLLMIKLTTLPLVNGDAFSTFVFKDLAHSINDYFVINILANGAFILAILWASWFCFVIDHKKKSATLCAVVMAIFSLFGLVHSVYLDGRLYLPWNLPVDLRNIVIMLTFGYLITAVVSCLLVGNKNIEEI